MDILHRRTPTHLMAQTAGVHMRHPCLLLMIMLPPRGIHEGLVVYLPCFVCLHLSTHTFSPLLSFEISLVILSSPSLFCVLAACLSRFPCAFLSYEYLLQGCVLFSHFCSNPFLLSARVCAKPTRSLGRSLHVLATLFLSLWPLSFFALMSILDGLFHSLSITLLFTCSATTLFRPLPRRCVLCQS